MKDIRIKITCLCRECLGRGVFDVEHERGMYYEEVCDKCQGSFRETVEIDLIELDNLIKRARLI